MACTRSSDLERAAVHCLQLEGLPRTHARGDGHSHHLRRRVRAHLWWGDNFIPSRSYIRRQLPIRFHADSMHGTGGRNHQADGPAAQERLGPLI